VIGNRPWLIGFDSLLAVSFKHVRAEMHNLHTVKENPNMQISRHWRLNSQRYRLQGVRYENGAVSLQSRPAPIKSHEAQVEQPKHEKAELKAAS
jgi:hypothetical protein